MSQLGALRYELRALSLAVDDVIVVRLLENVDEGILIEIREALERIYPGRRALILASGIDVEAVPLEELRRVLDEAGQ